MSTCLVSFNDWIYVGWGKYVNESEWKLRWVQIMLQPPLKAWITWMLSTEDSNINHTLHDTAYNFIFDAIGVLIPNGSYLISPFYMIPHSLDCLTN